ncbi:aspartate aminotransferase family protein [Polaribacter batillariae]|uniref:Aspartate aminotransferase family protein n=1 Tax=Polaribacter batillariae TaxID=2808900 RepID=A0ABX7STX7_9FLAO|nr:aspartate aminotransferase family protein [Polaribacter batillariae]QTD36299.1 aspartate aminotransferase family protein [Polaribacter batillariae]
MSVNQGENSKDLKIEGLQSSFSKNLIERDAKSFYHQSLSSPVFNTISKAEGAYLYDGDGKKYLDFHGNGVHTVGYNNPKVIEAISNQIINKLSFSPRRFTNEPAVALAEKLVAISPKEFTRVLFCPGGSEAIEMAVMLAKHHTKKWKTLSYYGTFHGAGFQAISIGADAHFKEGLGPVMPGAIHLELPDYYRNPWGFKETKKIDDEYLRQLKIQITNNSEIAALISEPIFYNSTVPSKYYWQQVKELCTKNNILLIFDEIYTAFGRTGKMFASEHFVTPDILVIGKGFGGGIVPFAGILGTEALNNINHKSIGHYTHEKNPLCSAVSKAVIDFVIDENLLKKTAELGAYFKSELQKLQEQFTCVGNVTGLGLNLAVDIVKNKVTKERDFKKAHELMNFCLKNGISFKLIQGNILNLKPSLIITKDEVEFFLKTLKKGLLSL